MVLQLHGRVLFPRIHLSLLFLVRVRDLVPFTRDYDQLKEKLTDLPVQDRTDLGSALVSMVDLIVAEWGSFAPLPGRGYYGWLTGCATSGCSQRKSTTNIPFSYQLHVMCIATREESLLSRSGRARCRSYVTQQACLQLRFHVFQMLPLLQLCNRSFCSIS